MENETELELILDEEYAPPAKKRRTLRPELIMAIIAAACAALLITVAVLCIPYYAPPDEDPEHLASRHTQPTETALPPDPTQDTGEPKIPTVPPDPNPYDRNDFQYDRHNYLRLQNLPSSPGVDVSAYQGKINWEKVAGSGIEFAIIRLGYRGYGTGKLVEDEYAQRNLDGAAAAGLKVGAYFFSQALSLEEADEEIEYMLEILGDRRLDMPIVLDWEIPTPEARTANMDARTLTDIQRYFIQTMKALGYQPMVYFNWYQSEHLYYLSELEDAPFWLALYKDRMNYPWHVEMWQYSCTGRVPGIQGDVDLNLYMP